AQKSSGPRSVEGKAVSRFNALKTGIDAKSNVIPGEDPDALETLAAEYHERFLPSAPEQRFLVDSLVASEWMLRRLRKIEAQLWNHEMAEGLRLDRLNTKWPLGRLFSRNVSDLTRLQRRIDSADRLYHRALDKLERLQATPAGPAPAPLECASELETPPNQPHRPEIGFVPPLPVERASARCVSPALTPRPLTPGPRPPFDTPTGRC
ncbi:MAG: hypothetical protein ABSC23_16550, partial [Bryobacteraceae bacterium]